MPDRVAVHAAHPPAISPTDPAFADPELANNDALNNAFEFGDDPVGERCPIGAHIRKAYPRDELAVALTISAASAFSRIKIIWPIISSLSRRVGSTILPFPSFRQAIRPARIRLSRSHPAAHSRSSPESRISMWRILSRQQEASISLLRL